VPAPAATPEPALTEAERDTAFYPDRAARIWVAGGLPANMEFSPPESSMVAGIVHGTAPICKRTVRRKPIRLAQRAVRPALLRQAPTSAPQR
jgi:hypothetical protein